MSLNNFESQRVENVMSMWRSGALDFQRTPGNKNITGLLCQRIDACEKYILQQAKVLRGPLIPLLKLWWRSRAA